ncbi:MAG: hypothetical protein C0200_02345 [Thermoproteota archaeon]|nr:MAG: hypothetical protein C0200_02345 [Candidatus Korarchaeota archaeon]
MQTPISGLIEGKSHQDRCVKNLTLISNIMNRRNQQDQGSGESRIRICENEPSALVDIRTSQQPTGIK